jgi:m7GpppX diphosphatase
MQVTIENVNYKFTPSKLSTIDSIKKDKLVLKNDIYEKYRATAEIEGELIICNDTNLMRRFQKKIVRESYDDYLKYIIKRDVRKDKWIYNIIDGVSEADSVLYRDNACIVIPSYTWDGMNFDNLHILCLPTDTSLRCIRSLNGSHIPLLEHMKLVTLEIISAKYNIDEYYIKAFFHYEPSTYHLHIHFVNTANYDVRSSIEYSHELNSVLFNLSVCPDYYQRVILNKRF